MSLLFAGNAVVHRLTGTLNNLQLDRQADGTYMLDTVTLDVGATITSDLHLEFNLHSILFFF